MKFVSIFALLLVASAQVQAANPFRGNSPVPTELQVSIVKALQTNCTNTLFNIQEESTSFYQRHRGEEYDSYYQTQFSATYLFDGVHPVGTTITVQSAKYAVATTEGLTEEVLNIGSENGVCR